MPQQMQGKTPSVRYSLAMPDSPDLFTDFGPEFGPKPARLEVVAGLVVANMGKPTAAQKRFNKLVASIDAARAESESVRPAVDTQRPAHQPAQSREQKREAKKAKRAPNAREQAAEQKRLDAQSALRIIYRQLASALHPDRASDAADRDRKTALMKAVNTAYEHKDLTELLRVQLTVEQVDASKLAALSDEKLQAMCVLLAERHKALQEDIENQRMELAHTFGYTPHLRFREEDLTEANAYQQQARKDEAAFMRRDNDRVQDEKAFKAWLKEQTRMTKAMQREADAAISMDDIISEMMR